MCVSTATAHLNCKSDVVAQCSPSLKSCLWSHLHTVHSNQCPQQLTIYCFLTWCHFIMQPHHNCCLTASSKISQAHNIMNIHRIHFPSNIEMWTFLPVKLAILQNRKLCYIDIMLHWSYNCNKLNQHSWTYQKLQCLKELENMPTNNNIPSTTTENL